MRLVEYEYCFLIEDFFSPAIIAGFTKPALKGDFTLDIYKSLVFFKRKLSVSYMNQLHSATMHCVKKAGMYEGDALFSKVKNNVLVVKTADCLPLFLESKELGIIGVVHMGWRGAKEGIISNIDYNFSSFKAAAGVGLRQCCYEVGKEFYSYTAFKPFLKEKKAKVYFDPIDFAKNTLIRQGLKEENFFDSAICSFCSPGDFFSYRRDKTSHRTLSFILKLK